MKQVIGYVQLASGNRVNITAVLDSWAGGWRVNLASGGTRTVLASTGSYLVLGL